MKPDCRYAGASAAVPGSTTATLVGAPPGRYAAQAHQHKNDDHEADWNIVGLPTEPVGLSNGGRVRLRATRFAEATFAD
jgi:uncharacterized protein (DUF2141 family)